MSSKNTSCFRLSVIRSLKRILALEKEGSTMVLTGAWPNVFGACVQQGRPTCFKLWEGHLTCQKAGMTVAKTVIKMCFVNAKTPQTIQVPRWPVTPQSPGHWMGMRVKGLPGTSQGSPGPLDPQGLRSPQNPPPFPQPPPLHTPTSLTLAPGKQEFRLLSANLMVSADSFGTNSIILRRTS